MDAEADKDAKIVVDPVYGTIHLDFLAVKIIDTPYFQRLRYIKQLAFADFVYPGATHTRFAHSIGVYHLACQMIKEIEAHILPEGAAQMSTQDKRCIRVAALCHDLGHGPFSHLYEQMGEKILGEDIGQKLKHEKISKFLVEKIFEECDLKRYLGAEPDQQIQLTKDLIERERDLTEDEQAKKYMFQIVSNKDSGVDVDKWDYFNRDATACGVPERFQYDRALSVARVVKTGDGMFELGYRDYIRQTQCTLNSDDIAPLHIYDAFNMYSMFHTRFSLYRKVYKHKAVQAVDLMITDACNLVCTANAQSNIPKGTKVDFYPITSRNKNKRPYSCMKLDDCNYLDVDKYLTLRDDVLQKIGDSSQKQYKEARGLVQRLHERRLYKLFDEICVKVPESEDAKDKAEEIKTDIEERLKKEAKDIIDVVEVKLVRFDYGLKQEDPVRKLFFYSKNNYQYGKELEKDEVSCVLPNVFQEYHVRVYEKFSGKEKDQSRVKENYATLKKILNKCRKSSTKSTRKKENVDHKK